MGEMEIYRELGRSIAARRRHLGLRQAELAQRIGISRASLANMEVGRQRMLVHQLYAIASALELDDLQPLMPIPTSIGAAAESLPLPEGELTPRQRAQIERLLNSASATTQQRAR